VSKICKVQIHPALTRYVALAALQQLEPDRRFDLDRDSYVVRQGDRYIAYRTWMSMFPLIEIFPLGQEVELLDWQEKHGYRFVFDAQDLVRSGQK
jgi:hypothetical protein